MGFISILEPLKWNQVDSWITLPHSDSNGCALEKAHEYVKVGKPAEVQEGRPALRCTPVQPGKAEHMGAEGFLSMKIAPTPPLILGLQAFALVDHVARVDWSLLDQIPGDRGGSQQVVIEDLERILSEINIHSLPSPDGISQIRTIAGGSIANTIRGLSVGFGVPCGLIGACGDDEQGCLFVQNMSVNGVNISRLRMKKGHTAQCACLVDAVGNRTMRPCLSSAVRLQPNELSVDDFKGSKWLALRYGFYHLDLIHMAIKLAKQESLLVSLDLASFEMVRDFRSALLELLEAGHIDLCFANEDEARELLRCEQKSDPEAAVGFLSQHCQWAVVTLGPNGCIAKHGKEIVRVPATRETQATDATGAGDLFASGFLYGLVKGLPLEDCCKVGACSGGSVIRALGGEVMPENWQWMYKQMQVKDLPLPTLTN